MQLAESLSVLASQGIGGRPVVVRNELPGIVTFTDDNSKITTIWQAKGDVTGKDVAEVSPTMLANPQFREQILRGIFSVQDSPEVLQTALDLQRAHWQQRQLQALNASQEIEQTQDQIIATGQPCIAPKGRELCGSYAIVLGKNPMEAPPLCAEHVSLASQYAPTETGRLVDGHAEVIWRRVTLARA